MSGKMMRVLPSASGTPNKSTWLVRSRPDITASTGRPRATRAASVATAAASPARKPQARGRGRAGMPTRGKPSVSWAVPRHLPALRSRVGTRRGAGSRDKVDEHVFKAGHDRPDRQDRDAGSADPLANG